MKRDKYSMSGKFLKPVDNSIHPDELLPGGINMYSGKGPADLEAVRAQVVAGLRPTHFAVDTEKGFPIHFGVDYGRAELTMLSICEMHDGVLVILDQEVLKGKYSDEELNALITRMSKRSLPL